MKLSKCAELHSTTADRIKHEGETLDVQLYLYVAVADTLMPSAATLDPIRQRLPGTLRRVSVTSAGGERDKGRETHRESDRERERES